MKVIICGAGQVGSSIARQLANEGNEITVIDQNPELIQKIADSLDMRAILGHASHPQVLESAGAPEADMLIAVTFSDEVNMIACQVAHSLFNIPTKIARVRHQDYLNPAWSDLYSNDHLPIDEIISPEREVANAVVRRLHVPGATDMIPFADGRMKVVAVQCTASSPAANLPIHLILQRASTLKMGILGVVRNENFLLPAPDTIISAGDDIYFVSDNADVRKVMALFGHEEKEARRVLIMGGGNIGLFIAQDLEKEEVETKVKIIELNKKRAEEIACDLGKTTVINGSALDREILAEVNINDTDTIIAVTNDDEVNILGSLLAKRYGCKRAITLVNTLSYIPLLGNLGIDVIVNPRETTVSSILQHVRKGKIRRVHSLHNGEAEIIEVEAVETSPLIGKNIETLELPKGALMGAILRRDTVIIPDANTTIQEHDRIILLCLSQVVKKVEKIFSVSLEFF